MFFSALRRLNPLKLPVRARLGLIQILLLAALAVISAVAWHALNTERRLGLMLATVSRAERYHLDAAAMHDALKADVNTALRVKSEDSTAAGEVLATSREDSHRLQTDLEGLQRLELPADIERQLAPARTRAQSYITLANKLISTAVSDREQALTLEASFTIAFDEMVDLNDGITALLSERVELAENAVVEAEGVAKFWIVSTSIVTALLAWTFVALIAGSVRRSLRQVSEAARALAAGNLSVRSEIASEDEVGELASAMNKMADDLQNMIDRLLADADRDAFSAQLIQALEMAEHENDIRGVVSRAMAQISGTLQMELLLSNSNRSNLQRVAEHPSAGAPGCGVEALSSCIAIRKGSPMEFADSDALNACPRLRERPCGPMSAVCVPVTFMGRSFGVIHTGSTVRKTPSPQQLAQLKALGAHTGARIGTVRMFAQTHRQAHTDALTGLSNRRALQQAIQELTAAGTSYAFVLADLDHFKRLNDTQGHAAGDKALRLFAEVLRKSVRDVDHAARWGGEEFAVLCSAASAEQTLEVIERIRANLAESLLASDMTPFTASFGAADSSMAESFEEIMRIADDALYRSKEMGRDRATIGSPRQS